MMLSSFIIISFLDSRHFEKIRGKFLSSKSWIQSLSSQPRMFPRVTRRSLKISRHLISRISKMMLRYPEFTIWSITELFPAAMFLRDHIRYIRRLYLAFSFLMNCPNPVSVIRSLQLPPEMHSLTTSTKSLIRPVFLNFSSLPDSRISGLESHFLKKEVYCIRPGMFLEVQHLRNRSVRTRGQVKVRVPVRIFVSRLPSRRSASLRKLSSLRSLKSIASIFAYLVLLSLIFWRLFLSVLKNSSLISLQDIPAASQSFVYIIKS